MFNKILTAFLIRHSLLSSVQKLGKNNLKPTIANTKDKFLVIYLFTPGCPHCRQFKTIWDSATAQFNNPNFLFFQSNGSKLDPQFLEENNVDGFPELLVFYNGSRQELKSGKWQNSEKKLIKSLENIANRKLNNKGGVKADGKGKQQVNKSLLLTG